MVLFDNTVLSVLFHPTARPPCDSAGNPITNARQRVEHLVETLDRQGEKVLIATPNLTELLTIAGTAGPKYLEEISKRSCFEIGDFDVLAAVEASAQEIAARNTGNKKYPTPDATWAKVKFDREIVAIAKVRGVKTIYSDDPDVAKHAKEVNIEVIPTECLPLPPKQEQLAFDQKPDYKE